MSLFTARTVDDVDFVLRALSEALGERSLVDFRAVPCEPHGVALVVTNRTHKVLMDLVWGAGAAHAREVLPDLAESTQRWIEHGLDEWVGDRGNRHPRHTPSSSPEFLPRLRDYLAGQFNFDYALSSMPLGVDVVPVDEGFREDYEVLGRWWSARGETQLAVWRKCGDPEGRLRVSCGTYGGASAEDVEVYSDQLCLRCGHAPCAMCGRWCDNCMEDDTPCGAETACAYAAEPKFTTADGKPWPAREETTS